MVDGDFYTVNKFEADDELAENVKRMKDTSYSHCCNQHNTITTLSLAKHKLEQLQKLESGNIITKTIKKIQEKFGKMFYH